MENKNVFELIPPRIKYYLLDWKDNNMTAYIRKYGEVRLCDLTL